VKVFIGTEPNQRLACEVLKYTAQSNCSETIEFTEIGREFDLPQQTGFSFARWEVPKLCGYWDAAIYMDADMVVFGDLKELMNTPMSKSVLARPTHDDRFYTSFMLMDCGGLTHWDFNALLAQAKEKEWLYGAIMWVSRNSPYRNDFAPLSPRWNDMDCVKEGTKVAHFTDLKRQPWRYAGHPFGWVFQAALKSAMRDGFIPETLVRSEIAKGHVRQDLLVTP